MDSEVWLVGFIMLLLFGALTCGHHMELEAYRECIAHHSPKECEL